MSALAVVEFEAIEWHAASAAELLREPLRDAELPRLQLDKLRKEFDRILLMAGSKADYLENKFKNLILGAVAFTAPTTVYFGIWGAASSIGDTFNGATTGEVSGGSYARTSVTNNTTNFATVSGTTAKTNSTDIVFATATADWNSGSNVNQIGVLDGNAGTSGDNGLLWGDITTPKSILNGDTAKILTGDFSYTED